MMKLKFYCCFIILIFSNFVFAQDGSKNKSNESIRPPFLNKDEKVEKIFADNSFVVSGNVIDRSGKLLRKNFIKKIYFTDGKGNVLKTFDPLPPGYTGGFKAQIASSSKKYLIISRKYQKNQKPIDEIVCLDRNGNVLFTKERSANFGSIFIDDDKDRFMSIASSGGKLVYYSKNGDLLFEMKFSDQDLKKIIDLYKPDEDSPAPIDFNFEDSESQKFVAYSQESKVVHDFVNEFYLFDVGKAKVLFDLKTTPPKAYQPFLVFEDCHRVIAVEETNQIGVFKYVGFDFAGHEVWSLNFDGYQINRKSRKNCLVELDRQELINQQWINKQQHWLNVTDGTVNN